MAGDTGWRDCAPKNAHDRRLEVGSAKAARLISCAKSLVLSNQKDAFSLFMLAFSNLLYSIRQVHEAGIS